MITVRKSDDRGHVKHGWLNARHTFSFADFYDPEYVSYRSLRVMNEDRFAPGGGFPMHPHRDMEIITYVLDGAIAHKDSTGGSGVIRPGEVQYMRAGSGVRHSEFNPSDSQELHLYQIWMLPKELGLAPGYAQKEFGDARKHGLCLVASPDGRDGSLKINQDTDLYAAIIEDSDERAHDFAPGRAGWLQVARGAVNLNGVELQAGDGAKIENENSIVIKALEASEILLFDLA